MRITDDQRREARRTGARILTVIPLAMLGNFASEFYKRSDWTHFTLAVIAASALMTAFWLQWFGDQA